MNLESLQKAVELKSRLDKLVEEIENLESFVESDKVNKDFFYINIGEFKNVRFASSEIVELAYNRIRKLTNNFILLQAEVQAL